MLAVTTRNQLHSARFCVPMLRARLLIARQLASTPGLVRYASGVASPTEFHTLTVWEDKSAMQAFMRSGAHERFMWLFSRWTKSFWGMRWEPSDDEIGAWDGLRLAGFAVKPRALSPLVVAGLLPPDPPRAGPTGPRPASGAVEPRLCNLFGATARFAGASALSALRSIGRGLRQEAGRNEQLVRWAVGLDLPAQILVTTLWLDSFRARRRAMQLLGHDLGADWGIVWQPSDYEIGHWDGLRLRQAARQTTRQADRSGG